MKRFTDDPNVLYTLENLFEDHRRYVINNSQEIDPEVAEQKTRFEKFRCWLVYGHLMKDGKCLRCGKSLKS